jgi:protein disulfide-isomerase
MKNLLLVLFVGFFATVGFAQTAATTEYEPENEGWNIHLEKAYKDSKESGKPILANFTGSDWCGWCKKLTKSVFVHKEFKDWADDNVILLELDYPRRKSLPADLKEQNRGLQQAFRVSGYPTIWVFYLDRDDNGQFQIDPLGKTGYTKTVKEFTAGVDQMIAKKKKAE